MISDELSQRRFEDFQYFLKHVKTQEETGNFLSFYTNKVFLCDVHGFVHNILLS